MWRKKSTLRKNVYIEFTFFFLTCRYENPKLHASHFIWEKKTLPETCLFPMKDVLAFYYVITGNKTLKQLVFGNVMFILIG